MTVTRTPAPVALRLADLKPGDVFERVGVLQALGGTGRDLWLVTAGPVVREVVRLEDGRAAVMHRETLVRPVAGRFVEDAA